MRIYSRLSSGLLLAGFLTFPLLVGVAQSEVRVPDADALDAILSRHVDAGHFPFLYARIEDEDGRLVYEHSAVNRELIPDRRIDGDTWLRIWSMSKIVTITVVLDLVEDGLIGLDEPVTKYIPFSKCRYCGATARAAHAA